MFVLELFFMAPVTVHAQPGRSHDLVPVKHTAAVRKLPIASFPSLDKYRHDQAFDYREKAPEMNWLDRLLIWIYRHIYGVKYKVTDSPWLNWVVVGLCVLCLLYAIYYLFKFDKLGLFRKSGRDLEQFATIDEKAFKEADFQVAIAEALRSGDYRVAVRLWYLQTLRTLSQEQLIDWSQDKTNTAYLNEMRSNQLYDNFARLTYCFEYTVYGRFELAEPVYVRIEDDFREFNKSIGH